MFPTTIIENFFPDPGKIVDLAKTADYTHYPEDTNYPGARSLDFAQIFPDLNQYISQKILQNFYNVLDVNTIESEIGFQVINPMHEDPYHPKNRGWVHKDASNYLGGIIYLNENPDPDTGTSIYREKAGFSNQSLDCLAVKERWYAGENVSDEEYIAAYNKIHDQYCESVRIEHVYNRLVLFNHACYHGQQTFGSTQTRLTIYFFFKNVPSAPPFIR